MVMIQYDDEQFLLSLSHFKDVKMAKRSRNSRTAGKYFARYKRRYKNPVANFTMSFNNLEMPVLRLAKP
jgi:phage anti-repressor protein